MFLLAGCGGSDGETSSADPTSAAESTTSPAAASLVGEWERETTCAELVAALRAAGLEKFTLEFVAGNGFVPRVRSPDQIADPHQPCRGAVPRKHSHFFTEGGRFRSRDWNGDDVDDGRYRVSGDELVISKEFPDVTFRYRIEGDSVTFEPAIPVGCSTFRCAWSVSMAYPGKKWSR
ncbi:MAG: hypothetical protein M3310_02000, partial [Actinomycetota bacterium]|nr:hypothetical protein [Actinomycetota bacterium]